MAEHKKGRAGSPGPSSARELAAETIRRVAEDEAYASVVLDHLLRDAKFEPRDASFATQIVYGTLRAWPSIEATIRKALHKPDRRVDAWAMAVFRTACFQLLHMRTPPHAVVHASVGLVRKKRGNKLASFANGVLRKVAQHRPDEPTLPKRMELPSWLEERLAQGLSETQLACFRDRTLPPPTGLWVHDPEDRQVLADALNASGAQDVALSALVPNAITLHDGGDLRDRHGRAEGRYRVTELGSQLVASWVPVEPGMRIADCCAGRGGKTFVLASRVGPAGTVTAIDLHESKLTQLEEQRDRLGEKEQASLAPIVTECVDLTVGSGGMAGQFDVAFADLPCTAVGTLHRRPELLLRLDESKVEALAKLQLDIARSCADLVRPGGLLVVAVCSLLQDEAKRLRVRLLEEHSAFSAFEFVGDAADAMDDGIVKIGPWLEDADGFQMFALRRGS